MATTESTRSPRPPRAGTATAASPPAAASSRADRPAPPRPGRWRRPRPATVRVMALTLACLAFYLVHAFADHARYLTTGYDLGIFDQAIRAYAHFQAPHVPLKGAGYNILGDHFHPIIAVLAPLYWVWDNVGVLLIAQAALTAASVPVVYRFARRRTSDGLSLLIAAAYGFGWPLQGLVDFDFHEIAFATPLAALAIDALDRHQDRRLLLWCGLLLLVREDMGLIVALLGVLVLAQRRGRAVLAAGLLVVGVAGYLLTTAVVIPHFADGHGFSYGNQFSDLGPTVPAAVLGIVSHPWHAVAVFTTPEVKTHTLWWLFGPLLLLPLRSRYVLLAVPLLAERFFNSRSNLWTTVFHYNALPWLILTLAMIDAAQRLGVFDAGQWGLWGRRVLAVALVLGPIAVLARGNDDLVRSVNQLRKPYSELPAGWQASAQATVNWLPRDVCVAADDHLVPHLTGRDWTTVASAHTPDPDLYALDMVAPDTGGNPPAPGPDVVYAQAITDGYRPVFRSGTFVVLRSPHYAGPSRACEPLGPGKPAH